MGLKLPPGFELDSEPNDASLPPGFELDTETKAATDPLAPLREATAAHDAATSWYGRIWNDLKTGMSNVRQASQAIGLDVASRNLGMRDRILNPPEGEAPVLGRLAELMRQQTPEEAAVAERNIANAIASSAQNIVNETEYKQAIPQRPVMEAMDRAKTFGDTWDVFKTDPLGAAAGVTFQSIPNRLPTYAAGAAGALAGVGAIPALGLGMAVQGLTSGGMEYGSGLIEELADAGVNIRDPQALAAAFQNPQVMEAARNVAATRAAIIGTVDALSAGLAGQSLVPTKAIRNAFAREAANQLIAQPVTQAVAGATGEAASQLATKGGIEKPGAVFMEALGEFAQAPVEGLSMGAGALRDRLRQPTPEQTAGQPGITPETGWTVDTNTPVQQAREGNPAAGGPVAAQPGVSVATEGSAPPSAPPPPAPPPAPAQQPPEAQPTPPVAQQPPAEPSAPQPAPAAPAPEPRRQVTTTAAGRRVDTQFEVVDLNSLQAASGDLQPRDRTRAASDTQIANIVAEFDPARLIEGVEADRGAPIVGPDNIVESGNGRIAALRAIAAQHPDKYDAYRKALAAAGYDTTGVAQPVLVRRRLTEMTPEERKAFAYEANQSATMQLSVTERAKADSDALSPELLDTFDPNAADGVLSASNRAFVQGWVAKLPPGERNSVVDPDGALSQDGVRRLQAAILSRAYSSDSVVSRAMEATDDNSHSVTGGLVDAAPVWARMRGLISAGRVPETFDITKQLMAAVDMLRTMRERGQTPEQVLGQQDMLNPVDPIAALLFRSFFNVDSGGKIGRAASRDKIKAVLNAYSEEASKQSADGNLFGDTVTPLQALQAVTRPKQTNMFAPSEPTQAQQPEPKQPEPKQPDAKAPAPERKTPFWQREYTSDQLTKVYAEFNALADAQTTQRDKRAYYAARDSVMSGVQPDAKDMRNPRFKAAFDEASSKLREMLDAVPEDDAAPATPAPDNTSAAVDAYFDAVENAPTTEGILAAEENWIGGLANNGDPEAAVLIQNMPGYFDYRSHLEDAARTHLGDTFVLWRSMPREQFDEWKAGTNIPPVATTTDRALAEKWANSAAHRGKAAGNVVVRVEATPAAIVMRGKGEEREIVIDPNQISASEISIASAATTPETEANAEPTNTTADADTDVLPMLESEPLAELQDNANTTPGDKPDELIPRTGLPRVTEQVAFTPRTSIYRSAFLAAGLNPEQTALMPESEQIAILRDLLKQTFGFRDVIVEKGADKLETLDAMLDAYQNMMHMLHVLQLPHKALGLNGTLTMSFERYRAKYLGVYKPAQRTLAIPGRSNSFAHEWMHAFDHYLLTELQKNDPTLANIDNLVSDITRTFGLPPTDPLRAAFVNVMRALFADQAAQQAEILALQIEAAKTNPAGQPTANAVRAQEKLKAIEDGSFRLTKKNASVYAQTSMMYGNPAYWTNPAEMLARATEAFIASKMEATGAGNEFISKGDHAYLGNADRRLTLTFPKNADRVAIFAALDQLFEQLRAQAIFGTDPAAQQPSNAANITPANVFAAAPNPTPGLAGAISREINAFRGGFLKSWKNNLGLAGTLDPRYPAHQRIADHMRALFYSMRGVMGVITNRAPKEAQPFLNYIRDNLTTDPGSGRFQTENFEEAVEGKLKRLTAQLSQTVQRHGFEGGLTDAEAAKLRELLTSADEVRSTPSSAPIVKLAAEIRTMMKAQLYYVRTLDGTVPSGVGLPIGFVENYLPRRVNEGKVLSDPDGFEKDASKLYALVFGNAYPSDAFTREALREAMSELRPAARYEFKRAFRNELKKIAEVLRKMRRIENEMKKGNGDPAAQQAALDTLADELQMKLDDLYPHLQAAWANDHARAWQEAIVIGDPMDFGGRSPDARFSKKRKLPPETDQIMREWLETDPIDLITSYFQDTVARVEYTKRFGTPGGVKDIQQFVPALKRNRNSGWDPRVHNENTPEGVARIIKDFLGPNRADYTEIMITEAARRGALPEDLDRMRRAVQIIAGRNRDSTPNEIRNILGWVNTLGMLALLPRAVFSAFAEPTAVLARTRDGRASWETFSAYIGEAFRTASAKDRQEIAMALGIITSPFHDQTLNNRLGTVYPDSPVLTKITSGFYRRSGQVAITNAQMRSSMLGVHVFVRHLAQRIVDPNSSPVEVQIATADMRELGIPPELVQGFAKWAMQQTNLPTVEQLIDNTRPDANYMSLLGVALRRGVRQIIQNPVKSDRPVLAVSSPFGRMMFGIMSFGYSFFRNVILRQLRVIERDARIRMGTGQGKAEAWLKSGAVGAGWFAAFYAANFTGQLLSTIAREAIFNGERWEEKEKKGELWEWLLSLAFSRTGVFGPFDPLLQAITGLKYERDLTGIAVGPYPSYFLNSLQAIMSMFAGRNSSTNTSEWNAAKGVYQLFAVPVIALLAATLPAGPVAGAALGGLMMGATSNRAADEFADAVAGEKDSRVKAKERAGSGYY